VKQKKWNESKAVQFIIKFDKRMRYDKINVYAAQASFYLIMSVIPILMVMFTLLQYTPLSQEMVIDAVGKILNEDMLATVKEVVGNVYDGSITLISFVAVSLMWVAGKGIMGLMSGLNNIRGLEEDRNYLLLRARSSLYTIFLVIAFIVAMAILVFGFRFQEYLCELIPLLGRHQNLLIYIQTLLALCLLTLIFAALYVFLPNRRLRFLSQLPGAVFATLSWCAFSYFFSIYLDYAKNMSVIYGGLVTLVIMMLWLYICMYLWFMGAELNVYFEDPENFVPHGR